MIGIAAMGGAKRSLNASMFSQLATPLRVGLAGLGPCPCRRPSLPSLPQALEGLPIAAASRLGNAILLEPLSPMAQRDGPTD